MALKAPFTGEAQEIYKSEQAITNFTFFENGHWLMFGGGGRGARGGAGGGGGARGANRITKTTLVDLDKPNEPAKELWSTNSSDRYADHGTPLQRTLPNGERGIMLDGDSIYLTGNDGHAAGPLRFLQGRHR